MSESFPLETKSAAASVPRARWWRIGLLLFLIYTVAFADRQNISVAAPEMVKELHLSSTVLGVLLSAFFWGYVLTQVPGGMLANRIGPRWVIVGTLVVWGAAAIATGLVSGYYQLLAVRFAMGLAEGAVWPSFAVMFINWYPDSERGRAINFSEMALPISSIIMAPTAGWLIAAYNWETMFIVWGIPPLVLAAAFAYWGADHPDQDRFLSQEERRFLAERASTASREHGSFLEVLRSPMVWTFCLIYFLWITGLYSFGLWLPSLLSQLSSSGIAAVGVLSAIPFVLATVAMYLNARASDASPHQRARHVVLPMFLAGVTLLVQHVVTFGLLGNMILLIIAGIGLYAAFGPFWAWALQYIPRNQAGPAMGLINVAGNFGGIVGPLIVGAAAAGGAVANGFYVLGFFLLGAGLLAVATAVVAGRNNDAEVH
ncbi:MFS transporter [Saccharopolyspora phatthalungensis]|uniref:Sugar phosphate permease n=1 Tax=Saccharopolyspora phatthalungensis TaxID=664693 RepID=A0A840QHP1_9PSEU|nr:MFS transporter [Saccharopolyspora phatthalungensis]MBB5158075.1 sugar phosphate permease [Saccharopolyspora phatthalungensis]